MFEDNHELLNEFVIESRDGLSEIESDLLAIEAGGENIDVELVNKVFRAIHSIKGAAGFMGLSTIGSLSHSLENVLSLIRNNELIPTSARVNAMLEASDVLRSLIEDITNSETVDVEGNVELLTRIAAGEDIESEAADTVTPVSQTAASVTYAAADSAQCPQQTEAPASYWNDREAATHLPRCPASDLPFTISADSVPTVEGDIHVYAMVFDLIADRDCASNVVEWSIRLGDTGEVIGGWIDRSRLPGLDGRIPDSLPCVVAVSSILKPVVFARFWRLPEGRLFVVDNAAPSGSFTGPGASDSPVPVRSLKNAATRPAGSTNASTVPVAQSAPAKPAPSAAPAHVVPASASAPAATADKPAPAAKAPAAPSKAPAHPAAPTAKPDDSAAKSTDGAIKPETNVRVNVAILDRLMNLAGELVLSRNQLLQTISTNDTAMLESVGSRLDQVTSELQETIMQTRMQPIGNVFSRFTRIVRDLAAMLDKQCQLEITGKEVELDKTIIEAIGDPLTHLIRNSVDHGIERPEVRLERGKPEAGRVELKAFHQDGKVNISITDDGAGIDPARLRMKAVEKGLITQERADSMSDAEALRLIFAPGFSTAETVSAVSGRGVGMDVVKTNFERLGGSVDIDTVLGRGTTMTVRLPLTLAIIPSLVVRDRKQRFAIPQTNISELVRIRTSDTSKRIEHLHGTEVLRLRGSLLPLVRLTDVLRSESESAAGDAPIARSHGEDAATNIIVVEAGNLRYGLIVDGLHDSEEIVVKPLGRHMADLKFLAGATVLGDGQIALILDVAGMAARQGLNVTERVGFDVQTDDDKAGSETISTLLFTNHPAEWFGIPMSSVARIERIRIDQMDSVAGQQVLQYRGMTLSLLNLEDSVNARPRVEQDRLYVIVFRAGDREVGLIAPNIMDIRDISSDLDTTTFADSCLLGSLLLDKHPTRIVDPYELARAQHPEWFKAGPEPKESAGRNSADPAEVPKILLVEDSTFFRTKVAGFLSQLSVDVVTAEDGVEAMSILKSGQHDFTLVVTDIEMPNMNGFELCSEIRADQRFAHLPVVALTSLAGEEHVARGQQVGMTDYLIKLDRDRLVLTVTSLLAAKRPRHATVAAR